MHSKIEKPDDKTVIDTFIKSLKNHKYQANFMSSLIQHFPMNQIRKSLLNRHLEQLDAILKQVPKTASYSLINYFSSKKATREYMLDRIISQYAKQPFSQLFLDQFPDNNAIALTHLLKGLQVLDSKNRLTYESRIKAQGNDVLHTLVQDSRNTVKSRGRPPKNRQLPKHTDNVSSSKENIVTDTMKENQTLRYPIEIFPRQWIPMQNGESVYYVPFSGFDAPASQKPQVLPEYNPQEHIFSQPDVAIDTSRPIKRQKIEQQVENTLWDDLSSDTIFAVQDDFLTRLEKTMEEPIIKSSGALGLFGRSIAFERDAENSLKMKEEVKVVLKQ